MEGSSSSGVPTEPSRVARPTEEPATYKVLGCITLSEKVHKYALLAFGVLGAGMALAAVFHFGPLTPIGLGLLAGAALCGAILVCLYMAKKEGEGEYPKSPIRYGSKPPEVPQAALKSQYKENYPPWIANSKPSAPEPSESKPSAPKFSDTMSLSSDGELRHLDLNIKFAGSFGGKSATKPKKSVPSIRVAVGDGFQELPPALILQVKSLDTALPPSSLPPAIEEQIKDTHSDVSIIFYDGTHENVSGRGVLDLSTIYWKEGDTPSTQGVFEPTQSGTRYFLGECQDSSINKAILEPGQLGGKSSFFLRGIQKNSSDEKTSDFNLFYTLCKQGDRSALVLSVIVRDKELLKAVQQNSLLPLYEKMESESKEKGNVASEYGHLLTAFNALCGLTEVSQREEVSSAAAKEAKYVSFPKPEGEK